MLKLILLITPQIEHSHEIGEIWQKAGATGVTYIESYGLMSLKKAKHTSSVLPGMMSMLEILRSRDENNLSIFSVMDDALVQPIIDATQALVGDLNRTDNGVLFVFDVERAIGLGNYK